MYYRFIFACILLCFVGCSTLAVKPDRILSYNNGIAIIQDKQAKSKIQIEIAQEVIGGFERIPLIFYIVVENLHDNTLHFSPDNISFEIDNKHIKPYDFNAIAYSNLSVAQALYDYGIVPKLPNSAINDPFFSISAYHPYYSMPIPFMIDGGFFMAYRFYDYSFARANYAAQLESYNARKFLIAHYLRKNTLNKNDVRGGFVLIPYSRLKVGDMYINVKVGEEKYRFLVKLLKN